jgi:hypothetical protein
MVRGCVTYFAVSGRSKECLLMAQFERFTAARQYSRYRILSGPVVNTGFKHKGKKKRCVCAGLSMGPELAVADGALGFWQALERGMATGCWVHKTANVLNKLPKSQQSKAKRALQEI